MQNEKDHDPKSRQLDDPKQQDQLNERTKNIGEQPQGQRSGEASAPARESEDEKGMSNAGQAGFGSSGSESQDAGEDRAEQMSHADGSLSEDPNPDV
jgi:hypothetical protein